MGMRLYEFNSIYTGNVNVDGMLFNHNLRKLGEKLALNCTNVFCGKRIERKTFSVLNTMGTLTEVFVITYNILNGV